MISRFLSILTIVGSIALAQAQQQPEQNDDAICNGFRITSPTIKNLHWTACQCYQVSYDPGSQIVQDGKISVDLVNSKTNQTVSALVVQETLNVTVGGTNLFSFSISQNSSSGIYHYLVTLTYDNNNEKCEPKRSVDFQVTSNPNSPPSKC